MKVCYTISKPAIMQINCGVFTNKKSLFDALKTQFKEFTIEFDGVLRYEKKVFNYFNLCALVTKLDVGESFALHISSGEQVKAVYEITIQPYNLLTL